MRRRGHKIPGVARVLTLAFRGWVEYTEGIDAALDERIRAA